MASRGYHKEKELLQHYIRRGVFILHCSLVEKPLSPQELWPIGDEANTKDREAEEMKRRIEKRQQLLKALKEKEALGQDEKGL